MAMKIVVPLDTDLNEASEVNNYLLGDRHGLHVRINTSNNSVSILSRQQLSSGTTAI